MRISDLLKVETISVRLNHKDKTGLIGELLDLAIKTGKVKDRETALKVVIDRENLMSTGLEQGVAVPHAKTSTVDELVMSLGISQNGIDFQSADGKPSCLFFFLLAPETAAGPNVQVLAQIARLTNSASFCEALKNSQSSEEVLEIIRKAEK